MNPNDMPIIIVFAIAAFIGLSIAEGRRQERIARYAQYVTMKLWMEWVEEFKRTGRWNH